VTALSVNVNKIALLRNSRQGKGPDLLRLSRLALDAGAAGLTIHPRPDERHIRYADAHELAALLRSEFHGREFNIEGNPFEGRWLDLVLDIRPDQATLVPDDPNQNTSDHGFAMPGDVERLRPVIERLTTAGIRVSVFMDPDPTSVATVAETGADRVELYTESYAVAQARRAGDGAEFERVLTGFVRSAEAATDAGLQVNAGHDLNLANLGEFVAAIGSDRLTEVSIGHALVGDALELGLAETVRQYLAAIREAASAP
jgi:pyridoxine 5-phosphate synthase